MNQHLRRTNVLASILVVAVFAGAAPYALADDTSVTDDLTATQAERILKDFEIEFEELDNGAYIFEVDDLKMIFFNRGKTLQLYSVFRDAKVTMSRINEWNKTTRFAKAYLDSDNDPALEGDLELTGGVTIKNIKEWMKTYVACLRKFKEHVEQ